MALTEKGKQKARDYALMLINDPTFYTGLPKPMNYEGLRKYTWKFLNIPSGSILSAVTLLLWNHYSEEFNLPILPEILIDSPNIVLAIKDFLRNYVPPIKQEENNMTNALPKYQDQSVISVTLVDGVDSSEMKEPEFLKAIRKRMNLIEGYKDIKGSSTITSKMKTLEAEIEEITELMDSCLQE